MKSTIPFLPSYWVKVSSVILMFFCIGMANTQAQSYKPLNEAIASVTQALDVLKSEVVVKANVGNNTNGQSNTIATAPTQSNTAMVKTFEVSYFQLFLEKAKLAGDVGQGMQAVDALINQQGQPASRVAILVAARADLIDLITL